MIIKDSLKNLKNVSVCIDGGKDNKFKTGRASHWFKVYDATPEEVLKVIKEALYKEHNN